MQYPIQSLPSTFKKAFSHILAHKSCCSGLCSLSFYLRRWGWGCRKEINKLSRLSIFLACSGRVFLFFFLFLKLGGSERRWAVFVIHKLCWQILDIIWRIVSITSSQDRRGQIEIVCGALLGFWVGEVLGREWRTWQKPVLPTRAVTLAAEGVCAADGVQRSLPDKRGQCILGDSLRWRRPYSCRSFHSEMIVIHFRIQDNFTVFSNAKTIIQSTMAVSLAPQAL